MAPRYGTGPSPIRPLQEHIAKVCQCAQALIPFFQAVLQNDWELAQQQQAEIIALERAADQIKQELRLRLPKSLSFLPVSRCRRSARDADHPRYDC